MESFLSTFGLGLIVIITIQVSIGVIRGLIAEGWNGLWLGLSLIAGAAALIW